ncbi:uncharacterized protein LOC136030462 isoform X2 [Artemia franciscana]|uniref:uncharacterized protein LOC136030462 isoform X2 n=1 Tax=Artemia franciscana TaxID=6661 RepID=UPI0032DACB16
MLHVQESGNLTIFLYVSTELTLVEARHLFYFVIFLLTVACFTSITAFLIPGPLLFGFMKKGAHAYQNNQVRVLAFLLGNVKQLTSLVFTRLQHDSRSPVSIFRAG